MPAASTTRQQGITGHLQVRGEAGNRRYFASWWDHNGARHTTKLGGAHVKDSGKRTPRGAVVWRAAPGPCPRGYLTPKMAEAALEQLLDEARLAIPDAPLDDGPAEDVPTFGDAVDAWLEYLEVEKRRKHSTLRDARNVARGNLLPRFGRDTPLYLTERHEVVVRRNGRQFVEVREERRDQFTTDDVDDYRRELLASELSPRTVQKILVLLHGVFKLAKRRKLIASNPSEDAERVSLDDAGIFNVLEPIEFEAVYRGVLGKQDERPEADRDPTRSTGSARASVSSTARCSSTAFYAGPRLGELRDLPWRNVDFDGSMLRIESGFSEGTRSTPKGKRARSTPLVPILAQRLAALATRDRFTGDADYVFSTETRRARGGEADPPGFLRGPRPRRPRPSTRRGRPARQPAASDSASRSSPLVVHMGGQRVAADEGAGLRRSPGCQDHAAVRAPPDQDRGRGSRRRVPGRGALSDRRASQLIHEIAAATRQRRRAG